MLIAPPFGLLAHGRAVSKDLSAMRTVLYYRIFPIMSSVFSVFVVFLAPHGGNVVNLGPWLPDGGAGRPNGLTEGVWFVGWERLKITNGTPFAAVAALPPKGAASGGVFSMGG